MQIAPDLLAYIKEQLKNARAVLMTGAGFSADAKDKNGRVLPIGTGLAKEIWKLCFGDEPYDEQSSLQDLYEYALARHRAGLEKLMLERFTIDATSLPDYYKLWFAAPWRKIYTLNVDDLPEAAVRQFGLPRKVVPISGTRGFNVERAAGPLEVDVVHLNGALDDVPEQVTFSTGQYGRRLASQEPTYHRLVGDLASYPFVFVGTKLDEAVLWQHIEMRGARGARELREMRPRSILISPSLSRARRELMRAYNVEWLEGTGKDFAEVLAASQNEMDTGLKRLQRAASKPAAIPVITEILSQTKQEQSYFLLGAEPEWSDITSGRAISRTHDAELLETAVRVADAQNSAKKDESAKLEKSVLVTGTAGSGKSTSTMRLAVALSAQGRPVAWVDRDADVSPRDIRDYARRADHAPIIAIDDADRYGSELAGILNDLQEDAQIHLVIVAARSSRVDRVLTPVRLKVPVKESSVPGLTDSDIKGLLEVLGRENKLGILTGMKPEERERAFRVAAGRQLLVAMMEATSGKRFEEKVIDEWEQLPTPARNVYALVALATSFRQPLNKDDVLLGLGDLASGSLGNENLNALNDLARRHILLANADGSAYRARHRHIAEVLLDELQRSKRLGSIHIRLAYVAATKVSESLPRSSKPWRLLKSVINHDYLLRILGLDDARRVYERIEPLLSWDYHYLLQRGSLEVEAGDVRLAQSFLSAAYSLAPSDPFVATEYAYMLIRRAITEPGSQGAQELVDEALTMLEDQITTRGQRDQYPVHVLGSQVLAWVRKAQVTRPEKDRLLRQALDHLDNAVRWHPRVHEIGKLQADVKRELLGMQVK